MKKLRSLSKTPQKSPHGLLGELTEDAKKRDREVGFRVGERKIGFLKDEPKISRLPSVGEPTDGKNEIQNTEGSKNGQLAKHHPVVRL